MPVIRHTACRRTETPNAVMTTLASPTQGGTACALWRVDMGPGQAGPVHAVDAEQVWTVLAGSATIELDGDAHVVGPGDTVVMPASAVRRVVTGTGGGTEGFAALVVAPAGMRAYVPDANVEVAPGCATRDGDGLVPVWVV